MPRVAALKKQSQICFFLRGFTTEGCSLLKGAPLKESRKAYRVLSFGDGSHGALGPNQDHLGDAYEPVEVKGLPDDVFSVAAGHYHSLAVTSSGDLWAWGRNVEGQLGRGNGGQPREQCNYPQKVQGLAGVNVREAAGSGVVSMAIDSHGSLWAWGKSKRGQLGLGEQVTEAPFPQRVQALSGQQVVQVSLGWGHALACTLEGKIYSWGYSADGRLGFYPKSVGCQEVPMLSPKCRNLDEAQLELANKQVLEDMKKESELVFQWEPHLVDLGGLRAIDVACGFDHSLVLCERGRLMSFGDDVYGQLGRTTKRNSKKEWDVALNEQVISINAGLGHSLAIACGSPHDTGKQWENRSSGTAYTWGWNSAFQLGRMTCSHPMKVLGLVENEVLRLDGGRVHSVAVNLQGEAWTWGSGKNGRLGIGSFSDEHQPCLVESILDWEVCKAVCGMDHTVLLVRERSCKKI